MAGKSHQDIELAARVRSLTLQECEKHLKAGKGKLYEMVLSNLSRTVLPRLNEITGKDGKDLPVPIFQVNAIPTDNRYKEGIETE